MTLPPTINCTTARCQHMVLYGKHFDEQAWFRWTAANDTVSGECEFCGVSMRPIQGVPKHMRLQHHILRKCAKYMPASPTSLPGEVPRRTALPAAPTPTLADPTQPTPSGHSEYARMRNAVKPKPVICKKKAGKSHFDHIDIQIFVYLSIWLQLISKVFD